MPSVQGGAVSEADIKWDFNEGSTKTVWVMHAASKGCGVEIKEAGTCFALASTYSPEVPPPRYHIAAPPKLKLYTG